MPVPIERLNNVRSKLSEDISEYYKYLITRLNPTPFIRIDKSQVFAKEVAVPARVWHLGSAERRFRIGERWRQTRPVDRERLDMEYWDWYKHTNSIGPRVGGFYEDPELGRRDPGAWDDEWKSDRVHRAVIVAPPGAGKTFLTRKTVIDLAERGLSLLSNESTPFDKLPLPLHLNLNELSQSLGADSLAILANLGHRDRSITRLELVLFHRLHLQESLTPRLVEWMQSVVRTEHCWLVLDGFDRVQRGSREKTSPLGQLLEILGVLRDSEWMCHVILTSRIDALDLGELGQAVSGLTLYELAPFGPVEIDQFINRWFRDRRELVTALGNLLASSYPLKCAFRIPRLVVQACLALEGNPRLAELPDMLELFSQLIKDLARGCWSLDDVRVRRPGYNPEIEPRLERYKLLAYALLDLWPVKNRFTGSAIDQAIDRSGIKDRDSFKKELLDVGMLHVSGQQSELLFGFPHPIIQDYLAAQALSEQPLPIKKDLINRIAWLPERETTILFLSAILCAKSPEEFEDLQELLALLANRNTDDVHRHRLGLAAKCTSMIEDGSRGMRLDASIRSFRPLREHLLDDLFGFWWYHLKLDAFGVVTHLTSALRGHPETMERIATLLKSGNRMTTRAALRAVGIMGPISAETKTILDGLTSLLDSNDEDLSRQALWAVIEIGAPAGTPKVLAACNSRHRGFVFQEMGRLVFLDLPDVSSKVLGDWYFEETGIPLSVEIWEQIESTNPEILAKWMSHPFSRATLAQLHAIAREIAYFVPRAGRRFEADLPLLSEHFADFDTYLRQPNKWPARDLLGDVGLFRIKGMKEFKFILDQIGAALQIEHSGIRRAAAYAINGLIEGLDEPDKLLVYETTSRVVGYLNSLLALPDQSTPSKEFLELALGRDVQGPSAEALESLVRTASPDLLSLVTSPTTISKLMSILKSELGAYARPAAARAVSAMMERGIRIFSSRSGGWRSVEVDDLARQS